MQNRLAPKITLRERHSRLQFLARPLRRPAHGSTTPAVTCRLRSTRSRATTPPRSGSPHNLSPGPRAATPQRATQSRPSVQTRTNVPPGWFIRRLKSKQQCTLTSVKTRVGTAPECEVAMVGSVVDERQCFIEFDGSMWQLKHESRSQPTFVNGNAEVFIELRHRSRVTFSDGSGFDLLSESELDAEQMRRRALLLLLALGFGAGIVAFCLPHSFSEPSFCSGQRHYPCYPSRPLITPGSKTGRFRTTSLISNAWSTGTNFGGGRQASHWKDNLGIGIMDPTSAAARSMNLVTGNELQALDVIGWNVSAAVPEPCSFAVFGLGLINFGGYRLRRQRKLTSAIATKASLT